MAIRRRSPEQIIRFNFVDHGPSYVIVSTCKITCNDKAGEEFKRLRKDNKTADYVEYALGLIEENIKSSPLNPPLVIQDQFERFVAWTVQNKEEEFEIVLTYRRMGKETGFDTLVHLDNNIRQAREHIREIDFHPDKSAPKEA